MSLYNLLFEENEDADILLGMIGLNKSYFNRYRDVELIDNGTKIRVFTRLGGGNRKSYEDTWKKIRTYELYLGDYDNDYDETYAHIEYDIPEKYKSTAKAMFKGEPISFKEKFEKELQNMDKEGTEAHKRAEVIAKKFLDALNGEGDDGINIIEL